VKDPGAGEGDSVPVEVPAEVVDYLDQGKNPDEAVRHTFGTVLKRAQDIRGTRRRRGRFVRQPGKDGSSDRGTVWPGGLMVEAKVVAGYGFK
jgi:hypothetical protein